MRSLRARVALTALLATAVAFLLSGLVVVGTFAFEFREQMRGGGPPPWMELPDRDGSMGPPFDDFEDFPDFGDFGGDGPPPFIRALARRLALVGLGVLVLVAAAGLALGGWALRPLESLRAAAERVVSTRDLDTRLPQGHGPDEVDALAGSLNAMLERLQASIARTEATLEASRRFAADAGHELRTPLTSMQANLEVLSRSEALSAEERRITDDVVREQRRLVALLDGLQRLARGDAAEAVPRERFDLAELVDAAVANASARHPQAPITFTGPDELQLDGWADGLRLLVDNLLDNALRHGRPPVHVELRRVGGSVLLTVDDAGPGVPPDERQRLFERFARGRGATAPGSGLGLALVAQQAAVHGGSAVIEEAPSGGARVRVTLAAGPPGS